MVWVRLDDACTLHEKLLDAGTEGFALWVAMLCHCNRSLTNGRVKKAHLRAVWPPLTGRALTGALAKLVAGGLVEEAEDYWILHDYAHYQSHALKDDVIAQRDANRAKQKAFRDRERAKKDAASQQELQFSNPVTAKVTPPVTDAVTDPVSTPVSYPGDYPGESRRTNSITNSNSNSLGERESVGSALSGLLGISQESLVDFQAEQALEYQPRPKEYVQVAPVTPTAPSDPLDELGSPDGEPARSHPDFADVNSAHRLLCDAFRRRWEQAMGMPWTGTNGVPAQAQAYWFVRASRTLGIPVAEMLDTALDAWFADPWVKKKRYPWGVAKNQLNVEFAKAHRASQAEAEAGASRYVEDLGAFAEGTPS